MNEGEYWNVNAAPSFALKQTAKGRPMKNLKTSAPKFTSKSGFKNQDHGPGWISQIVAALKAGTSAAIKQYRNPISYRGSPPRWQDNGPIEPRPVSEISEPADIETGESATSDLTRKIDANANVPIHPAMLRQTKR